MSPDAIDEFETAVNAADAETVKATDANGSALDQLAKASDYTTFALALQNMIGVMASFYDTEVARKADHIARLKLFQVDAQWQAEDRLQISQHRRIALEAAIAERDYWLLRTKSESSPEAVSPAGHRHAF